MGVATSHELRKPLYELNKTTYSAFKLKAGKMRLVNA
jgi:hypothetical protein